MSSVSFTSPSTIPVADRVAGFSYAIRNIVVEAKKVEAAGRKVRYLNIGDPIQFGFQTPPHLIEAVERALHDGQNGYGPSAGIEAARAAVAADYAKRGVPVEPDRVFLTSGASEGIELALSVLANPGDEILVAMPTYPLYTAVAAKIGARVVYYRTDPANKWLPDIDHIKSLITPKTKALVVIDPNNPTGAIYPDTVRQELMALAQKHRFVLLADEVYAELAYDGPLAPMAHLDLEAPLISFGSLSKAYLAPGWRAAWMAVGQSPQLTEVAAGIRRLADGRLCSTVPMQHAIIAALTGDRTHQAAFRNALRERAEVTTKRLNAIPGMSCVAPRGAFYAMPRVTLPPGRTDEEYVVELLRATGVLCVHGSGFGTRPEDGFFRIVFLASPADLNEIYDAMETFTKDYLARA